METNKILTADMLDILFDGRNKTYGAYALRKSYDKRMLLSICIVMLFCAIVSFGLIMTGSTDVKKPITIIDPDWDVVSVHMKEEPKIITPPKMSVKQRIKTETTQFVNPTITSNKEVSSNNQIPDVDKLDKTPIGLVTQKGIETEIATPSTVHTSTIIKGELSATSKSDEGLFCKVEIPASFPGGIVEWRRYLERTLKAKDVVDAGAPTGTYTIQVQFIVDKNGNISNVEALNDVGYGMAEQAVKAIKNGPKWTPAVQNGMHVNYQAVQKVSFQIQDDE